MKILLKWLGLAGGVLLGAALLVRWLLDLELRRVEGVITRG